ncbi:MAG: Autophagy protein 22 [Stictis urceolatum]|nr:Autophagy protein 22 [Stictis urceolata]
MDEDVEGLAASSAPQYPGEDTRPTSHKELWGWYSYAWASEVFVICGVGSFIPITLEQLARERGVLLSDHKTPCPVNTLAPPEAGNPRLDLLMRSVTKPEKIQCVVKVLGREMNTASFAMYTFSISVLVQALVIVSMSGAADHGSHRKRLILSFAFVGSIATMLFLPVTPAVFVLASMFAIIANTCFGASSVLLNSFLPLLVRRHPKVAGHFPDDELASASYADDNLAGSRDLVDSTAALLPASQPPSSNINPPAPKASPELQLSTKISSYGIGIGYMAAVLVQLISISILLALGSSTFGLRVVLFFIGLWWLIFTLPSALFLRPRPGPPLAASRTASITAYLIHSWTLLYRTILQARRLRDISIFLLAWFLLSDALATVSSTAILFASTEVGMPPAALAFISVIATLFGVLGAFAWSALSRRLGLTPMQTLASCIALFELIPLYGLLGFIPAVQRLGALGMQAEWEMYVVGAVYGLVLGGVGAYCRSLFGELVPPGSEAAFYALYAITDKGSSVFGPAIVGLITDRWGGIRPAFVFLAVLIALPLPLFMLVDIGRGRDEARRVGAERGAVDGAGGGSAVGYRPVEGEERGSEDL